MPKPPLEPRVDVLHVEDDDSWAGLVNHWLTARGLTVQRMRSGREMRVHLSVCPSLPRCLLLDLSLGDDDGLTLCDHVKRSPRLQRLPVVVLTARDIRAADVLNRSALYRVEKGTKTEDELAAVILSILTQQDRDRGVIDAGDLRLEPNGRKVFQAGKEIAALHPGPFSALCLLARSSPIPVEDQDLYRAFLSRHPYQTPDHEFAVQHVLRNNVSLLRRVLGKEVGERIVRAESGYFYIAHGETR
jgi:DNA-binding response OmpR family regulator